MSETIKVVVEIPKETYLEIRDGLSVRNAIASAEAIKNGIPLPKGHGRLIDADALDFEKCTLETDSSISYYMIDKDDIDNAPTIVEADKTESEVKPND